MGIIIERKDGEMVVLPCCGFKIPPREEILHEQSESPEIHAVGIPLCGYYATVNGSYRLYKNAKGNHRVSYQYQIFSCKHRNNRIMLKDENRDIPIVGDVDSLRGKELMWDVYNDLKNHLESEGYNILADC